MSLGRAQARLAAISAGEKQLIVKEKTKMKNKGRVKVPYRTAEGRLLHTARGKILYNDIPHTSFPWKSQKEENAEILRSCLTLPKLAKHPRISPAGLHGRPMNGDHLQGYQEGKNRHKKKEEDKKAKKPVSIPDFPQHRRTSADGVMGDIQDIKYQDKMRSFNLKQTLDLNNKPVPKRKDSRAERMKALEQKIIARGKMRSETGTDSPMRKPPPPMRVPKKSPSNKPQFTLGFTVQKNPGMSSSTSEGDMPVEMHASGFDSWLEDFMARN